MPRSLNVVWLPWLVYASIVLQSIVQVLFFEPSIGADDEVLLYATVFVVLWIERRAIIASFNAREKGSLFLALLVLMPGILVYLVGHIYPLFELEVLGFFLIASSFVLGLAPKEYLRSALFIAGAGVVLVVLGRLGPELLSSQLAIKVASSSAALLNSAFIPVVSNGVYLYFGPYTAEVTHACSGMNSIFSLFALSLLYLREGVRRKYWHVAILVLLVIPVAVLTNMMRVILLVLATWYVGDWFASGIFHETAGIVVFAFALGLLFLIDQLLFMLDQCIR